MGWLRELVASPSTALVPAEVKVATGIPANNYAATLGAMPTSTGLLVSQSTAIQVSTVYACVRIRARDVARCTARILTRDKNDVEYVDRDHPLAALLRRPNRIQTWYEFVEQMHCAYLLRGNAYAVKLRNWRGQVTELIPVNPDLITVLEAHNGQIFYNTARSGLWLTAVLEDEPIAIPEEDMFHLKDLSFNSLLGVSRIAAARDAIALSASLEQQASRWAGNGARPAGILSSPKQLTDEAAARLKAQWENLQSGIQNSGRTAILEDGLKWEPMQLTSVDLEFINQRNMQVKEILRFFDVPPHKVGETEGVYKATIAELNADYVQTTVMGDLVRWEQRFDRDWGLDGYETRTNFDERQLMRSDLLTMRNVARLGFLSGITTQNEARGEVGLAPLPTGDFTAPPSNLSPHGSDIDGTAPGNGGRPPEGELPKP